MLTTLPTISSFQGTFYSIPLYITPPVGDYSYLVTENSTHAFCKNGTTGKIDASSSNQSYVINYANSHLTVGRTWQEKVVLMGNFTIDSAIRVYSHTWIEFQCDIYLEDNCDCNLIENAEWNCHDVTFSGNALFYGNYQNQNSGHGIYWRINGTNSAWDSGHKAYSLTIKSDGRFRIHYMKEDGLHINIYDSSGTFLFDVSGIRTWGCRQYGVYWNCVYDSIFKDSTVHGNTKNMFAEWGSSNTISDVYFGGGCSEEVLCLHGTTNYHFDNCKYDNGGLNHSIRLYGGGTSGCKGNQFLGGMVSPHQLVLNVTYDAIRLEGNSHHNAVKDLYIGVIQEGTPSYTNWTRYGVVEVDTSDYNQILGCFFYHCQTAVELIGANSVANHFWNGTEWID